MHVLIMLAAAAAVLLAVRPVIAVTRFARATPAARRHYPGMAWARLRWRWLARNSGLAPVELAVRSRAPFELAGRSPLLMILLRLIRVGGPVEQGDTVGRIHYPPAKFRADDYGFMARIKTVPRTGRDEAELAAPHLANAWKCHRVAVVQAGPGCLTLRGLRRDPLAEPFGLEAARASADQAASPWRLYLGRDEWGDHRHLPLAGITGIAVGGLPGYGKTNLMASVLCQLAPSPAVQFALIDGRGGEDYEAWLPRAWRSAGDDLAGALAVLEDVHGLMQLRQGRVAAMTGHRNGWRAGPTEAFPLIVTVIDECHTFLDVAGYKGSQRDEAMARRCAWLTGQLVRKGRSSLMLTIPVTQKSTGDAIPTFIRDVCAIGISFACKTKDAAVAALGEDIRAYPGYCPTGLRDVPAGIGVATTTLATGRDPFTRLRVPEVSDDLVASTVAATSALCRDPAGTITLAADKAIAELVAS